MHGYYFLQESHPNLSPCPLSRFQSRDIGLLADSAQSHTTMPVCRLLCIVYFRSCCSPAECTSVVHDLPVPDGWRRAAPVRACALFNCCPKRLAGQTSNLGELLWFVEPGHCVRKVGGKLLRSPPLYKLRMDRHVLDDRNATERGFPLRDYCAAILRLGSLPIKVLGIHTTDLRPPITFWMHRQSLPDRPKGCIMRSRPPSRSICHENRREKVQ